jgi:hypothetical protein
MVCYGKRDWGRKENIPFREYVGAESAAAEQWARGSVAHRQHAIPNGN